MRTKRYIEFINELHSSTWRSASRKAELAGQSELARKFKNKAINSENKIELFRDNKEKKIEQKVLHSYIFDYYVDKINIESEEFDLNMVTRMVIEDYDTWDTYHFVFFPFYIDINPYEIDDEYQGEYTILNKIDIICGNNQEAEIIHQGYSKFANRKSAFKFVQLMHKLYILHDNNKRNKIIAKINNVKLSEVKDGPFKKFIDSNWGSWENFRQKINLRSIYDSYK